MSISRAVRRGAGRRASKGGALLAVLWLCAGLTVIAFSLGITVRGEIERAYTGRDGARAYYLAAGGLERALLYMLWGPNHRLPDGTSLYYFPGRPFLALSFPAGEAIVEVIPESSKINLNTAPPEELFRLLAALGVDSARAQAIVAAILDWRAPSPDGGLTPLDQFYLSLAPSFRARHASFEEIEEVLLVRGMTPELFYGTFDADAEGRLVPRGGLRNCITVFGASGGVDINTAQPAVLAALGVPPGAIAAILETRQLRPFLVAEQVTPYNPAAGGHLRIGGHSIYTLRATARLRLPDGRLSDLKRSVAAVVKFLPADQSVPYHVLRWYESEWVQ